MNYPNTWAPVLKEEKHQHVVFKGLVYNPKSKVDNDMVSDYFKERRWGQIEYILQFKTLPGHGDVGGRNDVVFKYVYTPTEMTRFAIERFKAASPPSWLEDYINNNIDIIPEPVLEKLKKLRCW